MSHQTILETTGATIKAACSCGWAGRPYSWFDTPDFTSAHDAAATEAQRHIKFALNSEYGKAKAVWVLTVVGPLTHTEATIALDTLAEACDLGAMLHSAGWELKGLRQE
jgi:hypothetical protein